MEDTVVEQIAHYFYVITNQLSTIGFADVVDIIVVAFFLYYTFKFMKDRRAGKLALGVILMLLMLLVGFLLIYLVMVAQFQSLRAPLIIIFTVPLAFTGGMLGLLITGQTVSVISMMGFVMLMGIVVNNGIVLVDCINRFRLEGMGMEEAIINAGSVRMRPVIMTAATTILGLAPLTAGLGTGAEMMQPVAIVCMGGLIYSTVTTLLIIPIMYRIFAKKTVNKIEEEELEIVSA